MLNKQIKASVGIILGVVALIGFFNFTNTVSAMTCDSATLDARVYTNYQIQARFAYSTNFDSLSGGQGITTSWQTIYSDTDISAFISGLSGNTRYFYRSETSEGYYGQINNFTTPPCDGGGTPPPAQNPSGNITATPESCTSPCRIDLSWNSQNVATVIRVYRDGQEWVTDNANTQGSATDWNVVDVGSHEYCLRAVDANWNVVSGNLDCDTVTVIAEVIQNPTANISSTQTCTAPCDVNINWNSNNVGSIVRIYRNDQFIWNQSANVSGSEKDWGMQAGTYRYCIRAVDNNWSESGDLNCSTTTVTAQVVQNPTATISSTPSCVAPCNVVVSWTSSNVSTDSNVVKIYKNGQFIWNQNANTSGTETEWSLSQGTYKYCIRAVKSDWSETGDLACATSTVTAPAQQLQMSGTLTPATYSCNIPSGSSSCPITFSWNTVNPVGISSVKSNGITLATGNSGNSSFSIPPGSKTFFLYNNSIPLDHKTVSAECASGLVWDSNSSTCKTQATNLPPAQTCQDHTALNYGSALPCRYNTATPPPVNPPVYAPVVTIFANPTNINYNGSSLITWNSFNATSCTGTMGANSWAGTKSLNGTWNTGALTATTTYNIICTNSAGASVNAHATVTVGAQQATTCQDTTALNYGGALPCNYHQVTPPPTLVNNSSCTSFSIPSFNVTTGQVFNATITVRNTGTTTWNTTSPNNYHLTVMPWASTWNWGRAPVTTNVAPGGSFTFNIPLTAPATPGSYSLNTQMLQENIEWFGPQCNPGNTITVSAPVVQNPPTVSISANPSSINYNGSSIVTWNSNNATSCVGNGGANSWSGNKSTSGNWNTGALTGTTTYSIICTSNTGAQATDSVTINVSSQPAPTCQDHNANNFGGALPCTYPPAPQSHPIVTLTVDDSPIPYNTYTIVRWSSANATSCTASGGSNGWTGTRNLTGNFNTGQLTVDKTYTITCSNSVGSDSKSATVRVGTVQFGTPVVTLSADNINVAVGGTTFLRWTSANANSCDATAGSNGWTGTRDLAGNFYTGEINSNTTYNITCTNNLGSDSKSVTVRVNGTVTPPHQDVTVTLTADNLNVSNNGNTTLRWTSTNATSCTANGGTNGWSGNKSLTGTFNTGALTRATTYSITCDGGANGTASAAVTVNVRSRFFVITL